MMSILCLNVQKFLGLERHRASVHRRIVVDCPVEVDIGLDRKQHRIVLNECSMIISENSRLHSIGLLQYEGTVHIVAL